MIEKALTKPEQVLGAGYDQPRDGAHPASPAFSTQGYGYDHPASPASSARGYGYDHPASPASSARGYRYDHPASPTSSARGYGYDQSRSGSSTKPRSIHTPTDDGSLTFVEVMRTDALIDNSDAC